MSQTVLQQAVEKVIDSRIAAAEKRNQNALLRKLRNIKNELLAFEPAERQQMEDAYNEGYNDGFLSLPSKNVTTSKTFNNGK